MSVEVKQQFSVRLEVEETFTVDEIWPDGDAPEKPTPLDVKQALFGRDDRSWLSGTRLLTRLEDIGLLNQLSARDIDVVDETAFVERMMQLKCKGEKEQAEHDQSKASED